MDNTYRVKGTVKGTVKGQTCFCGPKTLTVWAANEQMALSKAICSFAAMGYEVQHVVIVESR